MPRPTPNALRRDGRPGHYEVYYLTLTDGGASGRFDDVAWDLRWAPSGKAYRHVHPVAERLGLAQSVLELPPADLAIEGTISYAGARLEPTGVTYHDPNGEAAYCYNTETASIRLHLYERAPRARGWEHAAALGAEGRAHFEYAQRTPVPGQELHLI